MLSSGDRAYGLALFASKVGSGQCDFVRCF